MALRRAPAAKGGSVAAGDLPEVVWIQVANGLGVELELDGGFLLHGIAR
jgi:hypothetical protein